jgi:hypothetical protein
MTDNAIATVTEEDEATEEDEEESSEESAQESDVASPELSEGDTEDQVLYTTIAEQDAFNPTESGTTEYLQWQRALKYAYEKYIDCTKELKKQLKSMDRCAHVFHCCAFLICMLIRRAVNSIFKTETYSWLLGHWKWGKMYTKARVRQVLVTKLRKHRYYELKKRKVPCVLFALACSARARAHAGQADGQTAADEQEERRGQEGEGGSRGQGSANQDPARGRDREKTHVQADA